MFKEGLAFHATEPGEDAETAGDRRGLGRFRIRAPLVSDPQPYPRRGDGRKD